jgi:hypothetical protein
MGRSPGNPMRSKTVVRKLFEPVVVVVATLYFVIDALVLSILRPLLRRIARLKLFAAISAWFASLGPYPTLALFLIPLAILEPVKPVGGYLIATGRVVTGVVVLAVGELLKIAIVERIFHMGRDKLMTIPAFAWAYNFVAGWLAWLKALPAWQAVQHRLAAIRQWTRGLRISQWARSLVRRRRPRGLL